MKHYLRRIWKEWRGTILFFSLIVLPVKSVIADMNWVPTGSMNPTILEGDLVYINKAAYDLRIPLTLQRITEWNEPERGEIVVFFSPDTNTRMVKRIIAKPGDTIELRNNVVLINGSALDYGPLHEEQVRGLKEELRKHSVFATEDLFGRKHAVMGIPAIETSRRDVGLTTVPHDHYFMMGDNRDNSMDSRYYGFVDRERIVGEAKRVLLSFDIHHWLNPRFDRFGKELN
jgi:signal peptidase I